MPFQIRSLKLPFVKVSANPKTGRQLVWHFGPWQYNTRTGRHTMKLSKTVQYQSRTRTEKAAAAKKRATRRATERAGWDTYFAGKAGGVPIPPPVRAARKSKPAKKAAARKKRPTTPPLSPTATTSPTSAAATGPTTTPRPASTPQTSKPSRKPAVAAADGSPAPAVKKVRQVASGNDRIDSMVGLRTDRVVSAAHGKEVPPTKARSTSRRMSSGDAHVTMHVSDTATVGQQIGVAYGDSVFEPFTVTADREIARMDHENAGMCGQTTADGTPCQRLGTCPPGTHHPRRRSTGKKGKR